MTCVVAIAHNGKVYMGGDSAAVDEGNNLIGTRKEPKVFVRDDYIIGYAGSFRFGKIVEHCPLPPVPEVDNLDHFLNISFVEAIRDAAESARLDQASDIDSSQLLVGVRGRLFEFCEDWHLGEDRNNFNAIGSGSLIALGSLYSTGRSKSPIARIKLALEASEALSPFVRRPFTILER